MKTAAKGVAALLLLAALAVMFSSFLVQQNERIAHVRDEQRGLASARTAVRLLDRLVTARTIAVRASLGDLVAARRYTAARRDVLDAAAAVSAAQRRGAIGIAPDEVDTMERQLATLLPRRPGAGMEAFRAYGALTDSTARQISRIGATSGLVLDARPDSYALVLAEVTYLPQLMNAAGRAIALELLTPDDHVQLAVAKGAVEAAMAGVIATIGPRAPLDDITMRRLREPLKDVTWGATSLMGRLTNTGGDHRWMHGPVAARQLWTAVAERLEARLDARHAALERGRLLVAAAAGLLLLLALILFAGLQRRGRRLSRQDSLLHETRARYQDLVERVPAVTYVLDAAILRSGGGHPLIYVSPQVASLSGHDVEEWLADATLWERVLHPDDRATAYEQATAIAAGAGRKSSEYRIVAPDGRVVWVRDEAAAVVDGDGGVDFIQGVWLDVTDRRRAEDERDSMQRELQVASKLEAVGQLAAGVAHEINTPIQFVGDSMRFLNDAFEDLVELVGEYRSQLARAEGVDAERIAAAEGRADLDYLRERVPAAFGRTFDGVGRVTTIVQAMKTFSHSAGVEKAPADLNEAIRTTLVVCHGEYKYVADVDTQLGDLPPIVCHVGDLNQVILNLVVNAAHAIEDSSARGVITITTALDGDDAVIAVSDTGCGIADAVIERIFDPFFTTKEVGRGSGQGLALARSIIVDKHGGSIEVETSPGAGTTFTVRIPVEPQLQPVG